MSGSSTWALVLHAIPSLSDDVAAPTLDVLVVALLAPLVAMLAALVLPAADRLTLRHVGVIGGFVAFALSAFASDVDGARLLGAIALPSASLAVPATVLPATVLPATALPALLSLLGVTPMALRAGAPRIEAGMRVYVVAILLHELLLAGAILVPSPVASLVCATLAAVPLYALVALHGGPVRGTTTLRAATMWLIVDTLALAVLVWACLRAGVGPGASADVIAASLARESASYRAIAFLALVGPGLVRLAAGPHAVWSWTFFDQAPVSAACLAVGAIAPGGALLLARAVAMFGDPVGVVGTTLLGVLAVACLGSGLLALAERNLRKQIGHLCGVVNTTAALGLLGASADGIVGGLLLVTVGGFAACFALMALEAVDRRLETHDAVELLGLSSSLPLLAAALSAGLGAIFAAPIAAPASPLWTTLRGLMRAPHIASLPPAVGLALPVLVVLAWLLGACGPAFATRRLWLGAAPKESNSNRVSFTQMVRLLVPALALVAATLASGPLAARLAHASAAAWGAP